MSQIEKQFEPYRSPLGFEIRRGGRSGYSSLDVRQHLSAGQVCSFVVVGEVHTDCGVAQQGYLMFHPIGRSFYEFSRRDGLHEWIEFADPLWPRMKSGWVADIGENRGFAELEFALDRKDHLEIAASFYRLLDRYRRYVPKSVEVGAGHRFDDLIEWMHDHSGEGIGRDDLADRASMNPNAFDKAFRREYGVSPMQMLRQIRLQQARVFLLREDENLEVIAYRCGFGSAAYFSRCFKETHGVSPSEWRLGVNKTSHSYYM